MTTQLYPIDTLSEGHMTPQTDEERAFQERALARFLRRECSYCGDPRPIDDVLCRSCRARIGLLNEVIRRAEGHADDPESDVVAQVAFS